MLWFRLTISSESKHATKKSRVYRLALEVWLFPALKRIFTSLVSLWIVRARRELMKLNGLPCDLRLDSGASGLLKEYLVYCSGGRPDYLDKPVGLFGQSPIAIQVRLDLTKKQGEALISITPRSDAKNPPNNLSRSTSSPATNSVEPSVGLGPQVVKYSQEMGNFALFSMYE